MKISEAEKRQVELLGCDQSQASETEDGHTFVKEDLEDSLEEGPGESISLNTRSTKVQKSRLESTRNVEAESNTRR